MFRSCGHGLELRVILLIIYPSLEEVANKELFTDLAFLRMGFSLARELVRCSLILLWPASHGLISRHLRRIVFQSCLNPALLETNHFVVVLNLSRIA